MAEITLYTRVYNTEKYLLRCLNSVVNQTYKDFKHIVIDNGCTDGCTDILKDYAKKYSFVHLIRFEKNMQGIDVSEYFDAPYHCILDSDDWLEEDFFEKMLYLIKSKDADIVSTGNFFHDYLNNNIVAKRYIEERLIVNNIDFSKFYSSYHVFFRTTWGKLYKTDVYKCIFKNSTFKLAYGNDTLQAFECVRNSKKICVDNSVLYHYQLHQSSSSYIWNSERVDSDIILYNDAIDFLSQYGPISDENMLFTYIVYSNAIHDTISVLDKCTLSYDEKLRECRRIVERKETIFAYKINNPQIQACKKNMLILAVKYASILENENNDFTYIINVLSPKFAKVINHVTVQLFQYDNVLLNAFLDDNIDDFLYELLTLIKENKFTKKFDLTKMVGIIVKDNPILCNSTSAKFLRKYSKIYIYVWQKNYISALKDMTEVLINQKNVDEIFLQLYLNISAILERVDEFLFGKIKMVELYFKEKRYQECRRVLDELEEMGVEDTIEIKEIKNEINDI